MTVPIFASREILDIYTACKDSGEVVDAQNKWIENLQKQHQASDDSESFLVDISLLKRRKITTSLSNSSHFNRI